MSGCLDWLISSGKKDLQQEQYEQKRNSLHKLYLNIGFIHSKNI